MLFIEAPKFTELVKSHLNDEEYAALQWLLLERPDAGAMFLVAVELEKSDEAYKAKENAVVI